VSPKITYDGIGSPELNSSGIILNSLIFRVPTKKLHKITESKINFLLNLLICSLLRFIIKSLNIFVYLI